MGIFASIRERRVLQWLGGYIAAGFLALEGVDQLVGYAILPELAYHITLVFYLAGMPAAFILAWFHGQRGTQKPRSSFVTTRRPGPARSRPRSSASIRVASRSSTSTI